MQTLNENFIWAPSSEFVSSSIPSWHILTAHAQPFRGARDLVFCLKVPLDSLSVWASSGGSGETARMRRLAWTFAARIGDKYQIRLTRSILQSGILIKQRQGVVFEIGKLQQLAFVISRVINFYMALQLPFMNFRSVRISLVSDVYAVGCLSDRVGSLPSCLFGQEPQRFLRKQILWNLLLVDIFSL